MHNDEKRTMNRQVETFWAPESDISYGAFAEYCTAWRRRQDIVTLIRQINQMIKAVQRHRGMSMGLLAGSDLFRGDFVILQRQLQRRLLCLEVFAVQTRLLSERERTNIHHAWQTIHVDWQDDDVIDNFELHSHLIDSLQTITVDLARQLERPVSEEVAETRRIELPEIGGEYPRMFRQIELLHFSTRQAPDMIEQVARIRGLATYAAAKKHCDYHHDRKLRYAISCARKANEKLRQQAERLESIVGAEVRTLSMIKTYELKLMFLLSTVEMDILAGNTITAESRQLFRLATEIIDIYIEIVDECIDVVDAWHVHDMEQWAMLDQLPESFAKSEI